MVCSIMAGLEALISRTSRVPQRSLAKFGLIFSSFAILIWLTSCSQEDKQPREGSEVQPGGDEVIVPPANLAGAYLVEPKLSSCSSEKSLSDLTVFCSYKLKAKATGRQSAVASADARVVGSSSTGLAVDAASEAEAIAAAQKNLVTLAATFQADGKTRPATTLFMFKYAEGKVLVYARAAVTGAAQSSRAAVMVQFGAASVEFKNNFENPVAGEASPSEPLTAFESKLFELLRSLGVELVVVTSAPQGEPQGTKEKIGPSVRTTEVLARDVLAFLALGRAAIDGVFKD